MSIRLILGKIVYACIWPAAWVSMQFFPRSRVAIISHNEVLLVKDVVGPNVWSLPGGGLKFGESPEQAAVREIAEELGVTLRVNELHRLSVEPVLHRRSGILFREYFFVAKLDDRPEILLDKKELFASAWHPVLLAPIPSLVRRVYEDLM